jgi:hypothetical protein
MGFRCERMRGTDLMTFDRRIDPVDLVITGVHEMSVVHKSILCAAVATVFAGAMIRADDQPAAKPQPRKPLTFKDDKTAIIFYVESDGRHVAAIDRDGKVLWHRDPFEEHGLKPYRKARPVIAKIGSATGPSVEGSMKRRGQKGPFIYLSFDSTQTFVVDEITGESVFEGQD